MANENDVTLITAKTLWDLVASTTYESNVKGKVFQVNLTDFPVESVDAFIRKGVQRLINDATTSASGDKEAMQKLAQSKVDDLLAGVVSKPRGTGAGWAEVQLAIIAIMRAKLTAKGSDKAKTEYKALESQGDKQAWLWGKYDGLGAGVKTAIEAQATKAVELAKAEKARLAAIDDIDFE